MKGWCTNPAGSGSLEDFLFFFSRGPCYDHLLLSAAAHQATQYAVMHTYIKCPQQPNLHVLCSLWDSPNLQGTASLLRAALLAVAFTRRD